MCYSKKYNISKEEFEDTDNKDYYRVSYAGKYRGDTHSICNLRYKISKVLPVVLHNRSKYNYYFTMKELGEEIKKQFESCR